VTILGSRVYNNNRPITINDEFNQGRWGYHTQNVVFKNSIVSTDKSSIYTHAYWEPEKSETIDRYNLRFADTLVAENNHFFSAKPQTAFQLAPGGKPYGSLAEWQALRGADANSTITKGTYKPAYAKPKPKLFARLQYLETMDPDKNVPAGAHWSLSKNTNISISSNGTLQFQKHFFKIGMAIGTVQIGDQKSVFFVFGLPTWQQWYKILFQGA
jgi:hypothetical protein